MKFTWAIALFPLIMIGTPIHAQTIDESLCVQFLARAKEVGKKCFDGAISQEDKKSCLEKQETCVKKCDDGECKLKGRRKMGISEKAYQQQIKLLANIERRACFSGNEL